MGLVGLDDILGSPFEYSQHLDQVSRFNSTEIQGSALVRRQAQPGVKACIYPQTGF